MDDSDQNDYSFSRNARNYKRNFIKFQVEHRLESSDLIRDITFL